MLSKSYLKKIDAKKVFLKMLNDRITPFKTCFEIECFPLLIFRLKMISL